MIGGKRFTWLVVHVLHQGRTDEWNQREMSEHTPLLDFMNWTNVQKHILSSWCM